MGNAMFSNGTGLHPSRLSRGDRLKRLESHGLGGKLGLRNRDQWSVDAPEDAKESWDERSL